MKTGFLYLIGVANALDCSDTFLYLPKAYSSNDKVVYQAKQYQALSYTSTAPTDEKAWHKLGDCEKGINGKTVDCSTFVPCDSKGTSGCIGNVKVTEGKGSGAFNCGWSVQYSDVPTACKYIGFCDETIARKTIDCGGFIEYKNCDESYTVGKARCPGSDKVIRGFDCKSGTWDIKKNCESLGDCTLPIKDDPSHLDEKDCSQITRAFLGAPANSVGIDANGIVYVALTYADSNAPAKPWAPTGRCTEKTKHGKLIDCSKYPNAKLYMDGEKYNAGAIIVKEKYLYEATGYIDGPPETKGAYKPLGYCQDGTTDTIGQTDCKNVPLYIPRATYIIDFPKEIKYPEGLSISPFYVKHQGMKYEVKWQTNENTPAPGKSDAFSIVGKCTDSADVVPSFDCSMAIEAKTGTSIKSKKLVRNSHHLYLNLDEGVGITQGNSGVHVVTKQLVEFGKCKPGTETDAGLTQVDCENTPLYVPGSNATYEFTWSVTPPTGLSLSPLYVKHKGMKYQLHNYATKSDKPGESGAWDLLGKCKSHAEALPVFDCSMARKIKPGMIVSGKDVQSFLYYNHILYLTFEYHQFDVDEYEHPKMEFSRMIELGTCKEGTEGTPKPKNIVDCKDYVYFNPRGIYMGGSKVQLEGIAYSSSVWGSYQGPDLGGPWNVVGSCSPETTKTIKDMIRSEKDYSEDQKGALSLCCKESYCAWFDGRFFCMKDREQLKTEQHLITCPFEKIQANREYYSSLVHKEGGVLKRKGITTCDDVNNYQVMTYFNDEIVPSPGRWHEAQVIPFTDVGMAHQPDLLSFFDMGNGKSIKHFFLGFAQAEAFGKITCEAQIASVVPLETGPRTWENGQVQYVYKDLNEIRRRGGDWAIAFGGYSGVMPAVEKRCVGEGTIEEKAQRLAKLYSNVLEVTKSTLLNFDIEQNAVSAFIEREKSWPVRNRALQIVEEEREKAGLPTYIVITVPVLPSGLTDDGLAMMYDIFASGVSVHNVLAMTMDYGPSVCPSSGDESTAKTMFECENSAMMNLAQQLFSLASATGRLSPEMTSVEHLMPLVGSCPMIGQNDVGDEVYTYEDIMNSVQMQTQTGMGMSSFWSVTRDKSCSLGDTQPKDTDIPSLKEFEKMKKQIPKPPPGFRGNARSSCDDYSVKGAYSFSHLYSELTNPGVQTYSTPHKKALAVFPKKGVKLDPALQSTVYPLPPDVAGKFPAHLYTKQPVNTYSASSPVSASEGTFGSAVNGSAVSGSAVSGSAVGQQPEAAVSSSGRSGYNPLNVAAVAV